MRAAQQIRWSLVVLACQCNRHAPAREAQLRRYVREGIWITRYPEATQGTVVRESLLCRVGPNRGRLTRRRCIFDPLQSSLGGFALFWSSLQFKSGAPLFFLLFGGFLLVMGLYLYIGASLLTPMVRGRNIIGVTNDRILILSEFSSQETQITDLRT